MFKEGIRDDPLSLFRTYLEQREQMVQINGQESKPGVVKIDVVQGGVLSPKLSNIFVNDMFGLGLNEFIQMYADDIVIKYSASSLDELLRMINEDMLLLRTWFSSNMLALNVEKTKFVLFERRSAIRMSDNHVVRYGDGITQGVDPIKYLGLYLDTKLGFSDHIRHIRKKKYCQLCLH
jgi:hypothetical protein